MLVGGGLFCQFRPLDRLYSARSLGHERTHLSRKHALSVRSWLNAMYRMPVAFKAVHGFEIDACCTDHRTQSEMDVSSEHACLGHEVQSGMGIVWLIGRFGHRMQLGMNAILVWPWVLQSQNEAWCVHHNYDFRIGCSGHCMLLGTDVTMVCMDGLVAECRALIFLWFGHGHPSDQMLRRTAP